MLVQVLVRNPAALLLILLSANVLGSRRWPPLPRWESQVKLLVPVLGLVQAQLLQLLGE